MSAIEITSNRVTYIFTYVTLFFIIMGGLGCKNTRGPKRPAFEKAKFILQLDETRLLVSEVMCNLDEPWEITWGPDEHLWFTEKKGNIMRMDPATGKVKKVLAIPEVFSEGNTPGLLGMVLHPDFNKQPFVYMHYTYVDSTVADETGRRGRPNYVRSRLMRYEYSFEKDTLIRPDSIMPKIPANRGHNGSRLAISTDGKLLFAIGDVGNSQFAQTPLALPGKVLRINLDGTVPEDNPIAGSYFYSMGHRNPQGLVAANGKIYASEHGPNNDDELNLILPGGNYGWPFVEGYCDKENEMAFCDSVTVTKPIFTWSPTIAPAGLDYYDHPSIPEWRNSLLLTTLKGRSLWQFKLDPSGEEILQKKIYLQKQFGRLRDLCVSASGDVYVITSNSDWHIPRYGWMYDNVPKDGNDRILKISAFSEEEPGNYSDLTVLGEDPEPIRMIVQDEVDADIPGASLYQSNCAICHLPSGNGIPNYTPPLIGTKRVADKDQLIQTTLFGMSGQIEVKGAIYNDIMPGFSASLTDEELAEILTFVRTGLNKHTDSITTKDIRDIRKTQKANRQINSQ